MEDNNTAPQHAKEEAEEVAAQPQQQVYTHQVDLRETIRASSTDEAVALFLQVVWRDGGGMPGKVVIEEEGDPSTMVGNLRRVGGGVREQILERCTDEVLYKVVSGMMPVKTHLGRVRFTQSERGEEVLVEWRCRFTPYWGLGWAVSWLISTSLTKMLQTLRERSVVTA
ncbi:hypothetical protein QOT17_004927 [Balamuthia mandrillaris]